MKTDIKTLLKKGLTGEEVGKIVVKHLLEGSSGKETAFTEAEIDTLVNSLIDRSQSQRYNEYNNLWSSFARTAPFIQLLLTETENELTLIQETLKDLWIYYEVERRASYTKLVTQKQYNELADEQKKERLNEKFSLSFLFFCLASNYVLYERGKIKDRWAEYEKQEKENKNPDIDGAVTVLKDLHSIYGEQELIDKVFKPKSPIYEYDGGIGIEAFREDFPELYEIIYNDIQKFKKEGKLILPDKWELFTPEQARKELLLSGEELYSLDIQYLKENIFNTYITPDYLNGKRLAVIQDPPKWRVDDKGHYKEGDEAILPFLELHLGKSIVMEKNPHLAKNLINRVETIDINLAFAFGIYEGIKAVSEKIDIPLYSLVESKINEIENKITYYNFMLKTSLPNLKIDEIREIMQKKKDLSEEELKQDEKTSKRLLEKWESEYPYIKKFRELKPIDTEQYKTSEEAKKIKKKIKDNDIGKIDVWRLRDIYEAKYEEYEKARK